MGTAVSEADVGRRFSGEGRTLSIVIPAYNEAESVPRLVQGIRDVVAEMRIETEIVFVDDGSTDGTAAAIEGADGGPVSIKLIRMRTNFGKSIALAAGFAECKGDLVVTMDADLQDDPREIPALLAKIDEGWDLVSGWKRDRRDPREKRWASRIFNGVVSKFSGLKLHDFNCGLKAYRQEVVRKLRIYGGRHRFIPVIAHSYGFRVGEIPTVHHERKFGVSKYGLSRYTSGMFDFFTILFLMFYQRRPLHFIGKVAAIPLTLGALLVVYVMIMKFWFGETGNRPSLIAGVFMLGTAFQIFFFGLLAELVTHIRLSEQFDPTDFVHSTKVSPKAPAGAPEGDRDRGAGGAGT